jgi:hypothetical protein
LSFARKRFSNSSLVQGVLLDTITDAPPCVIN